MPDLLLEIGTEELPAGYIPILLEQLHRKFADSLVASRITHTMPETTGTPRRLVAFVPSVSSRQRPLTTEIQGPPADIAFDKDGAPTPAGTGFAKKLSLQPDDLNIKETPKGKYCFARKEEPGQETIKLLPSIIADIVRNLTAPKSMHWDDPRFLFARPIRWLVALFGDQVIPVEIDAVAAGRTTRGHRFLSPAEIELPTADFDLYRDALRKANVTVEYLQRHRALTRRLEDLLPKGSNPLAQRELVDEVVFMLEYPNAAEGRFDESFLDLPDDVIEAVLTYHQKSFPVRDAQGNLLPCFIFTLDRDDEHIDQIRKGNENVVRARLADGRFFWNEDRKATLESRVPMLRSVLFQEKLGTYLDRARRIEKLSRQIAEHLDCDKKTQDLAARAALLCKTDLLTHMVVEFPFLQGKMGCHYALADGEPQEITRAIAEHYMPRSAADPVPPTTIGAIVSLADKADTLTGCFAAGLIPTGSQDPYALRRAAIGIIRLIEVDRDPVLRISLKWLFATARMLLPDNLASAANVEQQVLDFLRDRLYQLKLDAGSRYDILNALMASGIDDLVDFNQRLSALDKLMHDEISAELVILGERTHNISASLPDGIEVNPDLFSQPEENEIWSLYQQNRQHIRDLIDNRKYVEASNLYVKTFSAPVHNFFERVFVNVDDEKVRYNRMALMKAINLLYSERVADLSKIVPPQS